jgi:hypothetical protein
VAGGAPLTAVHENPPTAIRGPSVPMGSKKLVPVIITDPLGVIPNSTVDG